MQRRQFLGFLTPALLAAPVALLAFDDHDHDKKRYYDRDKKDYHEWNEQEDKAYRRYLDENHREYRDWNKVNRTDQAAYWRWRHAHMEEGERHDH